MNWKKLSFWSGLGGLVLGTAAYALKKSATQPALYAEAIPLGVRRLFIELAPQATQRKETQEWVQHCFVCEPTRFYVWNVLPSSRGGPGSRRGVSETRGTQVFFVVPTVRTWQGEEHDPTSAGKVEDAFYATIRVHNRGGREPLVSQIARDYPLEFRKCLVGGSPNGIETGEVVVSSQAVLDYRFDMTD